MDHKIQIDIENWKKLLLEKKIDHLELTYEDILESNFDLNRIWDFLDVRRYPQQLPTTHKIIRNYNFITNLDEIKESMESKKNGYL